MRDASSLRSRSMPAMLLLLIAGTLPVQAEQLLTDPGFEGCPGGGTPPILPWHQAYAPATAGGVITATAARTGQNGLWAYTCDGADYSFTCTFDSAPAVAGTRYEGAAWVRTAPVGPEGTWVAGSWASVRICFIDAEGAEVISSESARLTQAGTAWTRLHVVSDAAPALAASVQLRLHLVKPADAHGQSVANFDDAYLSPLAGPWLQVRPKVLGFGLERDALPLVIENVGTETLTWQLAENADWLSLSETSGQTTASDTVTVTVDRAGATSTLATRHAAVAITTNAGSDSVQVLMELLDPFQVPAAPAQVWTDGPMILVRPRRPDGSLGHPRRHEIRGACWSPAGIGTAPNPSARQAEFASWYERDIQLLHEMHANTVRVFLDFGTTPEAYDILDYLYANQVMAIVGVDYDGTYDMENLDRVVEAYRDHPAVLLWAVGNEWNINMYYGAFDTLWEAAAATEAAAQRIKALDAEHPVATIFGEIDLGATQPIAYTDSIVNDVCPSVDVWGVNIYRGESFGTLFDQWASISAKPMFVAEFGADSYHTTRHDPLQGHVDEGTQADFSHQLWMEVVDNLAGASATHGCAGGTVFAFNDEWWKADNGDPCLQEPHGYYAFWNPAAFPDGFANEEYFGLVTIDRVAKASYGRFQSDFLSVATGAAPRKDPPAGRSHIELRWTGPRPWLIGRGSGEFVLTVGENVEVQLDILDVAGRRVQTLHEGRLPVGRHRISWDARGRAGERAPAGCYFALARSAAGRAATSFLLLRP